jgi:hypothetical protein
MYCDFNPRLFKPFTSMKTKIKPELSDDWEIIPDAYNTNLGMMLFSKKLNQKVADIELRRFLQFSKEQNLTIQGLKLQGTYVIGNDRSVYTEEMFNKWKDKFESRTETIIDKKDYKVGHRYKTPCGAEFIYLGVRYKANLKNRPDSFTEKDYTKITKKYYVCDPQASQTQILSETSWKISELGQKFTKDLGQKIDKETADLYLKAYKANNLQLVCFEKEKPKTSKIGLKEITEDEKELQEKSYGGGTSKHCLVMEKNNKFYAGRYGEIHIYNDKASERDLKEYNPETGTKGKDIGRYYSYDKNLTPDKTYRLDLI